MAWNKRFLVIFVSCMLLASGAATAAYPNLPVVASDTSAESLQKTAPLAENFLRAKVKTRAWAAISGENLLVFIRCDEPSVDKVNADSSVTVWAGDYVSIAIDTNRDLESMFLLAVNAQGRLWDGRIHVLNWCDPSWKSDAKVKVFKGEGFWSVSLKIPLVSLGAKPAVGDEWGLAFGRNRIAGKKPRFTSSTGQSARISFKIAKRPGEALRAPYPFVSDAFRIPGVSGQSIVTSPSRGALDASCPDENVFQVLVDNTAGQSDAIEVSAFGRLDGKTISVVKAKKNLPAGAMTGVNLRYQVDQTTRSESFAFVVTRKSDGKELYRSTYTPMKRIDLRVHSAAGSFDKKLLSKSDRKGLGGYRGISRTQIHGLAPAYADLFAVAWREGDWFRLCKQEKMIPWLVHDRGAVSYNDIAARIDMLRKIGVKMGAEPQSWGYRKKFWHGKLKFFGGYVADPIDRENHFKSLRKILDQYGDDVGAVLNPIGLHTLARRHAVQLFEKHK